MTLIEKMTKDIQQKGGLIVSCQPVDNSPMDKPEIVAAMAQAAVNAGAIAVRIEGIDNLRATRPLIDVPIIGIVKRDLPDSPVRITPWLSDVDDLAKAGADIIAFDGTDRVRPVPVKTLLDHIHRLGRLAMADCATFDEGMYCQELGTEFIGSTMSGYTGGEIPKLPDLQLVTALAEKGCRVIAEGRYNTPMIAARGMQAGAWAVTVGSALTRLEHVCDWFTQALKWQQELDK
ncbi:TPA: N-acetylmannosamine-6-phosphate 2-epimerase [Proteus mirabilis]